MKKYQGRELVIVIFESLMAIFYLFIGFVFLLSQRAETLIENQNIRITIGVILIAYGIFRVYRSIKKIF